MYKFWHWSWGYLSWVLLVLLGYLNHHRVFHGLWSVWVTHRLCTIWCSQRTVCGQVQALQSFKTQCSTIAYQSMRHNFANWWSQTASIFKWRGLAADRGQTDRGTFQLMAGKRLLDDDRINTVYSRKFIVLQVQPLHVYYEGRTYLGVSKLLQRWVQPAHQSTN